MVVKKMKKTNLLLCLVIVLALSFMFAGCNVPGIGPTDDGDPNGDAPPIENAQYEYSYVSVMINPQADFIIKDGWVKAVIGVNEDAELLLSDIDLTEQPIEDAVEEFVEVALLAGFIDVESDDNEIIVEVVSSKGAEDDDEVGLIISNRIHTLLDRENIVVSVKPGLLDRYPGLLDRYPGLLDQYPGLLDKYPGLLDKELTLLDRYPGLLDRYPGLLDRYFGLLDKEQPVFGWLKAAVSALEIFPDFDVEDVYNLNTDSIIDLIYQKTFDGVVAAQIREEFRDAKQTLLDSEKYNSLAVYQGQIRNPHFQPEGIDPWHPRIEEILDQEFGQYELISKQFKNELAIIKQQFMLDTGSINEVLEQEKSDLIEEYRPVLEKYRREVQENEGGSLSPNHLTH